MNSLNIFKFILLLFSSFELKFHNDNLIPLRVFYPIRKNCSNLLDLRNLQEQVKKAFCYQQLFWPFTVRRNCSSGLKIFANSQPSASNFKKNSRSLEQFFLTVGQNNFGNKIPNRHWFLKSWRGCISAKFKSLFFFINVSA